MDKSVGIPKAQNPALSLIFRRLCVPVASVMDVHEVGSSDAYFKPLNSLLRCPMHLQAPCEVVYRSPISIKGKSSSHSQTYTTQFRSVSKRGLHIKHGKRPFDASVLT